MKDDLIFIDRLGNKHTKPNDAPIKKRKSVYGLAITNNRILMVKPVWSNLWEIPGGGVQAGEKEDRALTREFKEEVGYAILEMDKNPIAQMHENFFLEDARQTYYHTNLKFFALTNIVKLSEFKKRENEIADIKWIHIFSVTKDNCHSLHFTVINDFIQKFI